MPSHSTTRIWGSRYAAIDVPSPEGTTPASSPAATPGPTPSPVVSDLGPTGRRTTADAPDLEHGQHQQYTRNSNSKNGHGRTEDNTNNTNRMDGNSGLGIRIRDYDGQAGKHYHQHHQNHQRRAPMDLRPNHEASIFVASLPTYMSDIEIKKELEDVLLGLNLSPADASEKQQAANGGSTPTIEVTNIKVVRDGSKSGVCAFVQVGSPDQALFIVEHTASHPLALRGTFLRLERAKAYRALRLTFTDGFPEKGSLKLTRHRASRFISIRVLDEQGEVVPSSDGVPPAHQDDSAESTLSIPLTLAKHEIIARLIEFFGPVEALNEEDIPVIGSAEYALESRGSWTVKWKFRNDCVSAFYAVQQVQGLRVMWAHIPAERFGYERPSPQRSSGTSTGMGNDSSFSSFGNPGDVLAKEVKALEINDKDWPSLSSPPTSKCDPSQHEWTPPKLLAHTQAPNPNRDGKERTRSYGSEGEISAFSLPLFSPTSAPHVNLPVVTRTTRVVKMSTSDPIPLLAPTRDHPLPSPPAPEGTTRTSPGNPLPTFPSVSVSVSLTPVSPTQPEPAQTFKETHDAPFGLVDPRSVFVGGLDGGGGWTAERLGGIFGGYGEVEDVKVFPSTANRSLGFAFVRFVDGEAAQKAVQAEDKRVYDGCTLKVQMRNLNGRRGFSRPYYHRDRKQQEDGSHVEGGRRASWVGHSRSPSASPHPLGEPGQRHNAGSYIPRLVDQHGRARQIAFLTATGQTDIREPQGGHQRWSVSGAPPALDIPLAPTPTLPSQPVRPVNDSLTKPYVPPTPTSPRQVDASHFAGMAGVAGSQYVMPNGAAGWYYYPYSTAQPYMWPAGAAPQQQQQDGSTVGWAGQQQGGQGWSYMPWSMAPQPVYPPFPITPPVNPDSPLPQDRTSEDSQTSMPQPAPGHGSSSTLRPTGFIQSDNILIPIYPQGSLDRYLAENPSAADPRHFHHHHPGQPRPYPPAHAPSYSLQQMPHVVPRTPTKGFPRDQSGANRDESGTIGVTAAQIFNPGSAFMPVAGVQAQVPYAAAAAGYGYPYSAGAYGGGAVPQGY